MEGALRDAARQLLKLGVARVAQSELHLDLDARLVWVTVPYGADGVAASGTGEDACLRAVRRAVEIASEPHPAEMSW